MIWLRIGLPIAAFVVAAILWLPMRMAWAAAPAQPGLSVEKIDGTVWNGKVAGVTWRGLVLGDFEAALSPLSLFPAPVVSLGNGTGPVSEAKIHLSADVAQLTGVEMRLALSEVSASITDEASLQISNGSLTMNQGACSEASGRVSTDAAPSLGVPAFEGRIACERGVLVVSLKSRDRLHALTIQLTGSDFSTVSVREASPEVSLVLAGLGILPAARGAKLE